MEWTKEALIQTAILCTSAAQGEKAIKFYESFGFKRGETLSNNYKILPGRYIFAGKELRNIDRIEINQLDPYRTIYSTNSKIIKLPTKPHRKFPREMMVSNNGHDWNKTLIHAKTKTEYPYVGFFENSVYTQKYAAWKYAKEID